MSDATNLLFNPALYQLSSFVTKNYYDTCRSPITSMRLRLVGDDEPSKLVELAGVFELAHLDITNVTFDVSGTSGDVYHAEFVAAGLVVNVKSVYNRFNRQRVRLSETRLSDIVYVRKPWLMRVRFSMPNRTGIVAEACRRVSLAVTLPNLSYQESSLGESRVIRPVATIEQFRGKTVTYGAKAYQTAFLGEAVFAGVTEEHIDIVGDSLKKWVAYEEGISGRKWSEESDSDAFSIEVSPIAGDTMPSPRFVSA